MTGFTRSFKIIGFDEYGENIIFRKDDEFYFIKCSLPKSKLISYLDIPTTFIDKKFRDCLLEEARLKGRMVKVYSLDGERFCKKRYFVIRKVGQYAGESVDYKWSKWVNVTEYDEYPDEFTCDEVKEMLAHRD